MRAGAIASALLRICASVLLAAPLSAWAGAAMWFRLPLPEWGKLVACGLVAVGALATIVALFTAAWGRAIWLFALAFVGVILWWATIRPPADGDWAPDVARQTTGRLDGDILTLSDVRDFDWRSDADFTERWSERSYDLGKLGLARPFPLLLGRAGNGPSHHELRIRRRAGARLDDRGEAGEERPVFSGRRRVQVP